MIKQIIQSLESAGAKCYYVGGYVRDTILGLESKDIDIEVFNLPYNDLLEHLKQFGEVDVVGQSFGVIKLYADETYDFSIPRRENCTGAKHTDFEVNCDPYMSVEEAMKRRDFTINAVYMNSFSNLVDYYEGQRHTKQGFLHPVSEKFKEDPLRVLRGFRFAGKMNMTPSQLTIMYSKEMFEAYNSLSKERVWEEWKRWTKGRFLYNSLLYLKQTGWINHYPQIANLVGLEQDPEFHKEGDVFTHTGMVLDSMTHLFSNESEEDKLVLILTALCHDMGKVNTTERVYKEKYGREVITSYNHASTGVPIAKEFLESIGCPKGIIEKVLPLIREHMVLENLSDKGIRKLAHRLFPANIRLLGYILKADILGKRPFKNLDRPYYTINKAKELNCYESPQERLIGGDDLLEMGYKPGPKFGEVIKRLYEMQLRGTFSNKKDALGLVKCIMEQV